MRLRLITPFVSTILLLCASLVHAGNISTVAGGGPDGIPAREANVVQPINVAFDSAGNLYITAEESNRIFKVDAAGIITVVAGHGNFADGGDGGPATAAGLRRPWGVAVDAFGNVYISDRNNHRIRRVDAATGIITTIAGNGSSLTTGDGGPAIAAGIGGPGELALDASGNLYFVDLFNNRVRRVDAATGIITTIAGSAFPGYSGDGGPAVNAQINQPAGITVDGTGNVFIADTGNHRIRRIDASTGIITTVAGTGSAGFTGDGILAVLSRLNVPFGLDIDAAGNLLIADRNNHRVRYLNNSTGVLTTVAGNGVRGPGGDGGPATSASLLLPVDAAVDALGRVAIALGDLRVRLVEASGLIDVHAGNGTYGFSGDGRAATGASLLTPGGVTVDGQGNILVADMQNHRVRRVDAATGIITTIAGTGEALDTIDGPGGDPRDDLGDGGPATSAALANDLVSVAAGPAGDIFIADGSARLRRVDAATGVITTVAGTGVPGYSGDDGPASEAMIFQSRYVLVDGAGNVFFSDASRVRRIDAATGIITTVAGNGTFDFTGDGGPATDAGVPSPFALALDAAGNLYIGDSYVSRVRRVDAATGIITTVAGNGSSGSTGDGGPATEAALSPSGLAVDGDSLFVADLDGHRIRRVDLLTGIITPVAGSGTPGFGGDGGPAELASFDSPQGLGLDLAGNLLVADFYNNRIRKVESPSPPRARLIVDPAVLLPADHRMVEVHVTLEATHSCAAPSGVLLSVTSSEPDDAPSGADGRTTNDIQDAEPGTADFTFLLRAERSNRGPGRVYTATYEVTCASGDQVEQSVTVVVPRSTKISLRQAIRRQHRD